MMLLQANAKTTRTPKCPFERANQILECMDQVELLTGDNTRWRTEIMHDTMSKLRRKLALEFGRRRGWKLAPRGFSLECLSRGDSHEQRNGNLTYGSRYMDHADYYRHPDRTAAAIAAHNYNLTPEFEEETKEGADGMGLVVEFPDDYPSWWYPNSTRLVVYSRK